MRAGRQASGANLPGLLHESSRSTTLGVEGYPGPASLQVDYVNSFATTDVYFVDVNNDGIADLVNGGSVLFGRLNSNNVPVYGISGDTPVPVVAGTLNTGILFGDFAEERDKAIDTSPLMDTVRRWVAPFTGTVKIEGSVSLPFPSTDFDGVRVAIQKEGTELWSTTIAGNGGAAHDPSGVGQVSVVKGDRLYFRVGSVFDGQSDVVAWNPKVTYLNVSQFNDVNNLPWYTYQASTDFTLAGRDSVMVAPLTGNLVVQANLSKTAVTSDDVTVLVTLDGQTVIEHTVGAAATGTTPIGDEIAVQKGQKLRFRLKIDSPIDVSKLSFKPRVYYEWAEGLDNPVGANGKPVTEVFPPPTVDVYPVNGLTAPQGAGLSRGVRGVPR